MDPAVDDTYLGNGEPRARPESLESLTKTSKFKKQELKMMYRGFKQVAVQMFAKRDTYGLELGIWLAQGLPTCRLLATGTWKHKKMHSHNSSHFHVRPWAGDRTPNSRVARLRPLDHQADFSRVMVNVDPRMCISKYWRTGGRPWLLNNMAISWSLGFRYGTQKRVFVHHDYKAESGNSMQVFFINWSTQGVLELPVFHFEISLGWRGLQNPAIAH